MGISDRMRLKNAAILADTKNSQAVPDVTKNEVTDAEPVLLKTPTGTVTAPGGMMVFRQQLQKHESTVKALEDELSQYRDGVRTVKLDTALIDFSKWANRHETSFNSQVFNEFRDEIAHAGGNIQPILIRPSSTKEGHYEIVFGHRRYAACKQLGLPVMAMIISMSDDELFTLMDRENRHRLDLSSFEQGEMWRRALDEGLFASARQLAIHVGVSHGLVNQCLALTRLPKEVLDCFASPTLLQIRWGKELTDRIQADPEGVRERIEQAKSLRGKLSAAKVFELLVGAPSKSSETPKTTQIKKQGKVVGKWSISASGDITLSINGGFLDESKFKELKDLISQFVAG